MVTIAEGVSTLMDGRYRIERELGRGGMATVFLATDTTADRQVAIKMLDPEVAAAVGAERFHREIRIASALTHPHILPVYDSGEWDGRLFYVMPVVHGESLRERIHQLGQLQVEEAVRLTCEIAGALEYAHSQGVVHRDIKPENILMEQGYAVLADFGIARAAAESADAPALTRTGMSLGTPTYMSPEQAMGDRTVDGRSDQYSLACVAYEMLTGQPPFTAPTAQALVARHLTTPVPLISTVRPVVSEELEEAILRALEKVPADRWETIGDFAAELAQFGALKTTTTRRAQVKRTPRDSRLTRNRRARRWNTGRWWAVCAAAVLMVTGGAAWRWSVTGTVTAGGGAEERRIAVLYFKDLSADGSLGYVADGLAEELIERLRDVQSLDVVSRDGVARFRYGEVAPDSVARALKVGTMVAGSVELDGDAVRVVMRVLDASGTDFKRASLRVPRSALATARDSVAQVAAGMLRQWIGEEVQLRAGREQARDAVAWSLVQRAERLRKDATAQSGSDSLLATRAFDSADSLLVAAETRDPRWSDPPTMRSRIALARARQSKSGPQTIAWLDAGMEAAERALRIDPRDADALELRGTLRFERYTRNLAANLGEEKLLLRDAQADLLRATEVNPAQANAWNVLSILDYRKPDVEMAHIHARRALEADAYLAAAEEVVWRLFATSYDVQHKDDAAKWCAEGRSRFPANPRFVLCRLWIGVMETDRPDVEAAWTAVREYVALVPELRRPLAERQARMLAAIPLIYAGQTDSARRVLAAARVERSVDRDGMLITPDALALTRLGDRAAAVRLLALFLAQHPQHRAGVTRNTWWWKDLQEEPDFRALIGTAGR